VQSRDWFLTYVLQLQSAFAPAHCWLPLCSRLVFPAAHRVIDHGAHTDCLSSIRLRGWALALNRDGNTCSEAQQRLLGTNPQVWRGCENIPMQAARCLYQQMLQMAGMSRPQMKHGSEGSDL
jgi:hypothetical protein